LFKSRGVIYHAAHQIAGLPFVKKRQRKALYLVVNFHSQVAHQFPRRDMRQVVAQKPEQNPQKVNAEQDRGQYPYFPQIWNAALDYPCHPREKPRGYQVKDSEG
jgi:hypothetical protein